MTLIPPAELERAWRRGRTAGLLLFTAVLISVVVSTGVHWYAAEPRFVQYLVGRVALGREDWATAQRSLRAAGSFNDAPALLRESYLGAAREAGAAQRWDEAVAALVALEQFTVSRDPSADVLLEAHPALRAAFERALTPVRWKDELILIGSLRTMSPANDLAFSPDGRRLLVATGVDRTGGVEIWDLATLQRERFVTLWNDVGNDSYPLSAVQLDVSPDGSAFVSAHSGARPMLALWAMQDSEPRLTFPGQVARFTPDGNVLAGLDSAGELTCRRTADGAVLARYRLSSTSLRDGAWAPSGDAFIAIDRAGALVRRDFTPRQPPITMGTFGPLVSFGQGMAVAGSADGELTIVDTTTGVTRRLGSALGSLSALALSPDGGFLATASSVHPGPGGLGPGVRIVIWDVRTGRQVAIGWLEGQQVQALVFSRDGRTLAVGSDIDSITFWRSVADAPPSQP